VILNLLEPAAPALAAGDHLVGRRIVNDALRYLATAKRTQDDTLDLDSRSPEAPGSALDLNG
jgi:hypothetical protein